MQHRDAIRGFTEIGDVERVNENVTSALNIGAGESGSAAGPAPRPAGGQTGVAVAGVGALALVWYLGYRRYSGGKSLILGR